MRDNPIKPTVDFAQDGVQHGFLNLPHSRDNSAWGSMMIPITVVKNGEGPTALLTGANHGDEYEGPVALYDLAGKLKPQDIQGRVIIVPAMNFAAFNASTRASPFDDGNMNRSFPGSPTGSLTEKIADYFSRTLLPMADYVLDFHSGGKSLDFVPFAACHKFEDKEFEARCEAAMMAFAAPYHVKMLEIDGADMYDTEAERQGKIFVTTELGGGGTATPRTTKIARRGVRNFLIHAKILDEKIETCDEPVTRIDMEGDGCFVISSHAGLIEYCKTLGDELKSGELIARIYPTERTGKKPVDYRAKTDGLFISRHAPGLIKFGDCLAVIGTVT